MAKIKKPLLSFDARGSLGSAITFVKRGKTNLAEKIPIPYDQETTRQKAWRTMFLQCVDLWHLLSAAEKQAWESAARPLHMTGYAWYLSQCLRPNPGIYLPLAGGTMSGIIDMGANKIINLAAPVNPNDAARLADAGGATTFLALTDTPAAYAGEALKVARVNAAQDALEFAAVTGGYTEGARVFHDAHQSIPDITNTYLAFNSERYDTDAIHDNVTNNSRLTCKTAGKYLITCHLYFQANATGERRIQIRINRVTQLGGDNRLNLVNLGCNISISTVFPLAVNDYVEVRVWQSSGGALLAWHGDKWSPEFMMQRIG